MAYCCTITTTKWNHVSLFLESKKKMFDSPTLFCIYQLSSSDSSTLVYIPLRLVYIRLHSSVFRIDPLLQSEDQVTFDEHAVFTINTLTRGFCFIQCVTQFLRIGSV